MRRWHRRAVGAVATVAVVAGLVGLLTGAGAADERTALSSGRADPTVTDPGATSAYRSRLTITTAEGTEPCAVFPGAPYPVCGPILACYRHLGGPDGPLGPPQSGEEPNTFLPDRLGDRRVTFAGGTAYLTRRTGKVRIGRWYAYTPTSPTPPRPGLRC